jgi:hypothetical protein
VTKAAFLVYQVRHTDSHWQRFVIRVILRDTGIKQRRTVLISIPVITCAAGGSIGVDFPLYGKAKQGFLA